MSRPCSIYLLPLVAVFMAGSGDAKAQTTFPATTGLTQYTIGNPSGDETEMLELMNRTRANSAAEGQRLVDTINAMDPSGGSGIDLTQLLTVFQSYPARPRWRLTPR